MRKKLFPGWGWVGLVLVKYKDPFKTIKSCGYCATQAKTLSKLKLRLGKFYKGLPLSTLPLLSTLNSSLKLAVDSAQAEATAKTQSKHNLSFY
jgi:hypothetical protein